MIKFRETIRKEKIAKRNLYILYAITIGLLIVMWAWALPRAIDHQIEKNLKYIIEV